MHERPHLLVVDDDREVLSGMSIRLRAAGFDVTAENNGERGLAAAKAQLPDAIVLDLRMPALDGISVLRHLRAEPSSRNIPVVVVSANVADTSRKNALDLGARFFIEKPYLAATLIQAVKSAIEEAHPAGPTPPPADST